MPSKSPHKQPPVRMWTVYARPLDYPNSYVARLWENDHPTDSIVIAPNLELLRGHLMQMNLSRIPRHAVDDPVIVEVWL